MEKDYIRVIDSLFVVRELLQREILNPENSSFESRKALTAWREVENLRTKFEEMTVEEKINFKLF